MQLPKFPGISADKILSIVELSDGRLILKVRNKKGAGDFVIKIFNPLAGKRGRLFTPKHAHFAIDFYGKFCANRELARELLSEVGKVYRKEKTAKEIVEELRKSERFKAFQGLPGYDPEYILQCLELIFEQEDVNYPPPKKGRALAWQLLEDIVINEMHPVEAMLRSGLRI